MTILSIHGLMCGMSAYQEPVVAGSQRLGRGGGVKSAAIADVDNGGGCSKGEWMQQASKTSAYEERNGQ
jgi:hypothetical protein